MVVGIDEVGRGAWAGPLVVGAVCLNTNHTISGLTDSKLLTKKSRDALAELIYTQAAVGLGFVSPAEVDDLGLTLATTLACKRALQEIKVPYSKIIIDGSINYLSDEPRATAMIKADLHIPAVSAASIVAKAARDRYMQFLAKTHPAFGFDKHVGYGTAAHMLALTKYGATPFHRHSFKPIKALQA